MRPQGAYRGFQSTFRTLGHFAAVDGQRGITRRCAPRPFGAALTALSPSFPEPRDLAADAAPVAIYGGQRGIRTLEGLLTLTPLAGVRLRPLGHLSVLGWKDRPASHLRLNDGLAPGRHDTKRGSENVRRTAASAVRGSNRPWGLEKTSRRRALRGPDARSRLVFLLFRPRRTPQPGSIRPVNRLANHPAARA